MDIYLQIERLLEFAYSNHLLEEWDIICTRNYLYDLLGYVPVSIDSFKPIRKNKNLENTTAAEILEVLLDYSFQQGIIKDNELTTRDLFSARIMGLLTPRQSEIIRNFNETYNRSKEKATDDFYKLCRSNNYIQVDRINKNLYWKSGSEFGDLEISINLSKPEKNPKEIAAALKVKSSNYPKCLLCAENTGFAGHFNHPARQNLRMIPVTLDNEQWFFQYSPYVYYNEHCIILNEKHIPMKLSIHTFKRLLDFLEIMPHYFIGSNADLPIVGGSILSHDHFQGGRHIFPMELAKPYAAFTHEAFEDISISLVKWPMSVIRISGENKEALIDLCMHILNHWKEYEDKSLEIWNYGVIDNEKIPHNTITPIARKDSRGLFQLDLVLRNNRTTEEHPMGIFHPHSNLHNIKKENIGLIEVMGLAILPERLNEQLKEIKEYLMKPAMNAESVNNKEHPLFMHYDWMKELMKKHGQENSFEKAEQIIKDEVGKVFVKVLGDAGVFKADDQGRQGFYRFMDYAGFKFESSKTN